MREIELSAEQRAKGGSDPAWAPGPSQVRRETAPNGVKLGVERHARNVRDLPKATRSCVLGAPFRIDAQARGLLPSGSEGRNLGVEFASLVRQGSERTDALQKKTSQHASGMDVTNLHRVCRGYGRYRRPQ